MNNMEDRLWDYIDGLSSSEECTTIDNLMKTDSSWKMKYDELMALHKQLQSAELDEPSMGFKNRVMEQVLASPHPAVLKTKVNNGIIYSIAAFFIVVIGGMLAYMLSQVSWNSSSSLDLPSIKVPAINWSMFSSSSYTLFFLSAGVVLALLLVDRYVSMRRNAQSHS
jgi:hypothetical protein